MSIEWFRDLIICISGVVAIVLFIFVGILAYSIYRKTNSVADIMSSYYQRVGTVLDSIEATSATMRGVVCSVRDEMMGPMVQVMTIIQGIRQGIDVVNKFFKKNEGKDEGG